jgi:hypothetical protein
MKEKKKGCPMAHEKTATFCIHVRLMEKITPKTFRSAIFRKSSVTTLDRGKRTRSLQHNCMYLEMLPAVHRTEVVCGHQDYTIHAVLRSRSDAWVCHAVFSCAIGFCRNGHRLPCSPALLTTVCRNRIMIALPVIERPFGQK